LRERAPAGPEEAQVAAAGWRLMEYWPAKRLATTALVLATTGHDGMCRPIGYNAFVFVDDRFAGTLSPAPMFSREDGTLAGTPTLVPGGVEATFLRYLDSDPRCCPSRPSVTVGYRIERAAVGPVVVPVRSRPAARLPRTGSPGAATR
jgi:hypothetical protein